MAVGVVFALFLLRKQNIPVEMELMTYHFGGALTVLLIQTVFFGNEYASGEF